MEGGIATNAQISTAAHRRWGSMASLHLDTLTDCLHIYPNCLTTKTRTFHTLQEEPMESQGITTYWRKGHKKVEIFLYFLCLISSCFFNPSPGTYIPCTCIFPGTCLRAHLSEVLIQWMNKGKQLIFHQTPTEIRGLPLMEAGPSWSWPPPMVP